MQANIGQLCLLCARNAVFLLYLMHAQTFKKKRLVCFFIIYLKRAASTQKKCLKEILLLSHHNMFLTNNIKIINIYIPNFGQKLTFSFSI